MKIFFENSLQHQMNFLRLRLSQKMKKKEFFMATKKTTKTAAKKAPAKKPATKTAAKKK